MPSAYHGRVLHVDLSEGRWWPEELPELTWRMYLGGGALASYFMLRDMKPGADPLGPDNLFLAMTSVINGLPISGANRYSVAGKSPLSGGFGEAEAGGYWGPELKRSGFDGVVVHGRAAKPVYLFVHDGQCEIRDASRYWGCLSAEVQEGLEAELGDKSICVLQTGVAGEKGVLYAAVCNQMRHFHGRTGLGAVMGSKNLKAIVVRGTQHPIAADKEAATRVIQWFRDNFDKETNSLYLHGTAAGLPTLDYEGILPTRNFRDGSFELANAISGETVSETILHRRGTCYACAVQCKREVSIPERGVEPKYGGMEYEIIASLGSLCGVGDLADVAEASQLVNSYVLDGISTGVSIAFAMECYENGILTKADTDGIDLRFGNGKALIQMIHKIGRREGLGDVLALGVKRAAAKIGRGAERFALHVKGQELPMHEPRGKNSLALAYALSPTGADHVEAPHDPTFEGFGKVPHDFSSLGLLEGLDRIDLGPKKVRAFYETQKLWSVCNAVGMCVFVAVPIGRLSMQKLTDFINAATGWDMSVFELLQVGERANNISRLFNVREGFTAADDTLPDRMFKPLHNGALKGTALSRREFKKALQLYYEMAGWDRRGVPTPGKLAGLGLEWAAV